MRKPTWLKGEAAAFWQRHAPRLIESGQLTEQTADGFSQTCELWSDIRTADKSDPKERLWYVACNKLWEKFARQFGILPNLSRGQSAKPAEGIGTVLDKLKRPT
ncbi:hypothetical protein J0H58_20405 [bacterium]|nr:hypothetical protein [bacterium]